MEHLRTWRKARDLSSAEAGMLVGISGTQWTRYETGKRAISIKKITEISKLTGFSIDRLRPDAFKNREASAA